MSTAMKWMTTVVVLCFSISAASGTGDSDEDEGTNGLEADLGTLTVVPTSMSLTDSAFKCKAASACLPSPFLPIVLALSISAHARLYNHMSLFPSLALLIAWHVVDLSPPAGDPVFKDIVMVADSVVRTVPPSAVNARGPMTAHQCKNPRF